MSGGELGLRRAVLEILRRAGLDAQPVENVTAVGCPDVEYVGGWIELKKTKEWPTDPATPVQLDHDLSREQRIWLKRRCRAGGRAHVLVQIDAEFICLQGDVAASLLGTLTQAHLKAVAVGVCTGMRALRENLPSWLASTQIPKSP